MSSVFFLSTLSEELLFKALHCVGEAFDMFIAHLWWLVRFATSKQSVSAFLLTILTLFGFRVAESLSARDFL